MDFVVDDGGESKYWLPRTGREETVVPQTAAERVKSMITITLEFGGLIYVEKDSLCLRAVEHDLCECL